MSSCFEFVNEDVFPSNCSEFLFPAVGNVCVCVFAIYVCAQTSLSILCGVFTKDDDVHVCLCPSIVLTKFFFFFYQPFTVWFLYIH